MSMPNVSLASKILNSEVFEIIHEKIIRKLLLVKIRHIMLERHLGKRTLKIKVLIEFIVIK